MRSSPAAGSVFEAQNFWFGHFTVGNSRNASILIDTGSSDLIFNPGSRYYKPGPHSKNLHHTFSIQYETTKPDGSGYEKLSGNVFEDSVTLVGTDLTTPQQQLGVVTQYQPSNALPFPEDGLMGLAGQESSLGDSVTSWWNKLCASSLIQECRFGLALGADGTGSQYYGGVEYSEFEGDLTGPVGFSVGLNDVLITLDSGTATIIAPFDDAQQFFDASGMEGIEEPNADGVTVLKGYYSCQNPPQLGFKFPSASNETESQPGKVFDIVPHGLELNSTGSRCQSTIVGMRDIPFWLVGQAFMEGKYVDHNTDDSTLGFAVLK
ncbi:hypothetical protein N7470_004201 [Penicillium chermesinum]|nr:hypothetical protein N7470_004201 [Penicillium chermesinum]